MQTESNNIFAKIKKVRPVVTLLVISLTVIFFARTFAEYYQQLQNGFLSISPFKAVASLLLFMGYLYLRALSWRSLVNFLGESINKTGGLSVWFFSEATRYIPGNVWSFVSRAYLARQEKISKNVSLLVLPIEIMTVAAVTSALSLYSIVKNLERLPVNLVFYAALVTPPVALFGFLILQKIIKRVLGKLLKLDLSPKALLTAIALQIACWSLYSLGTIILLEGKLDNLSLLFSSTILAWLVGYLSLVTPMGLGVRESAFVLLLGGYIGTAQAVVIAVLSRIILIISELVILAFLVVKNKLVASK